MFEPGAAPFDRPYVDLDEQRDTPCQHRYVHGGFTGTDTRFSFYLPPSELYEGRFLTAIEGGQAGHEARAARLTGDSLPSIGWAFSCGAYLVESNGGRRAPGPMALTRAGQPAEVTAYAATAAATWFARELATEHYGERPTYGYVLGGSGGGRALLALENTLGIWDGCVQWVNAAGHGVSLPTVVMNAARVLGPKLRQVAAAWEPGGSRDPFRGLTEAESLALATLYRSGFQPGGEFQLERPGPELSVLQITKTLSEDYDPAYFEEFWSVPGHLGADGALAADVVDERVTVGRIVTAADVPELVLAEMAGLSRRAGAAPPELAVGIEVEGASPRLRGADLVVTTGAAAGRRLLCVGVHGDVVFVDFATGPGLGGVQPGDELQADNRGYLAYLHSYLHQVDLESPESRQFTADGVPLHPQRPLALQDILVGVRMTGVFEGKVIYVGSVHDSLSTPTGWPVTYAERVRRRLGAEAADRLRVWLNDNATHIQASDRPPGPPPVATTRLVDWIGSVEQAVLDLIGWVERGESPPPDTAFDYDDGRIELAPTATERGGIQPVVRATVNGLEAVTVRAGDAVTLEAEAQAPPEAGTIVALEWDVDGTGAWPYRSTAADGSSSRVRATLVHAFAKPGTYFPAVRATAHRSGDVDARHGRVPNLARVRVDVTDR